MGDFHLGQNHFKGDDHFSSDHLSGGVVVPPDLCPNHHFASWLFHSNHFASYHFAAVCIPVPPPPRPTTFSSGGGIGGGKTLNVEDLPSGIWGVNADTSTYATALAKKLSSGDAATRIRPHDPLTKTRKVPNEYGLKETIHGLRERVASLEDALARASAATMLPWKLYSEAKAEIDRLKAGLAAAEEEQARLRGLLEAQGRAIAELQAHQHDVQADPDLGVQYNILASAVLSSFPTFEQFYAQVKPQLAALIEPTAAPARVFPWAEAIAAAGGFLLTALIPAQWSGAKAVGYTASTALAFAAIQKLLRQGHAQ